MLTNIDSISTICFTPYTIYNYTYTYITIYLIITFRGNSQAARYAKAQNYKKNSLSKSFFVINFEDNKAEIPIQISSS